MPDEEPSVKCPHCLRWMIEVHFAKGHVVAHRCPGCDGYWFDGGELEDAVDVAAKELNVLDDAKLGDKNCPVDGEPMWQFDYPQTYATIDMCKRCNGIWLDRRELEEIKMVRRSFAAKGDLETHAPLTGFKGRAIQTINDAIARLMEF